MASRTPSPTTSRYLPRPRSQREPDAELLAAARHRVGDHAVQPDAASTSATAAKVPARIIVKRCAARAAARYSARGRISYTGSCRSSGATACRTAPALRRRVAAGAYDVGERVAQDLGLVEVHLLPHLFHQAAMPQVPDHADDGDPDRRMSLRLRIHAEPLADRALPRPGAPRQAIVDDRHRLALLLVRIGEGTPLHQPRAHGLEEAGGHGAVVRHRGRPLVRAPLAEVRPAPVGQVVVGEVAHRADAGTPGSADRAACNWRPSSLKASGVA